MSEDDLLIKQFAKDFDIPFESYKYNTKTLVVTYHCVDASPSEIDKWDWQVPAFVIKKHYSILEAQCAAARIDELTKLMNFGTDTGSFHAIIKTS